MDKLSFAPTPPRPRPRVRRAHPAIVISAWSIPILILGQFALLAAVPVVVAVVAVMRDTRSRALRWWVMAVAISYVAALVLWILRPERAQSLGKDMNPALASIIVAAAVALIARMLASAKR